MFECEFDGIPALPNVLILGRSVFREAIMWSESHRLAPR